MVLSGIVSILLGAFLFAYPHAGLLAWAWMFGIYAIIFGITLIAFGMRVHRVAGPTGAIPV